MNSCPVARVCRILTQARVDFDSHAATCGDRVLAVGFHPADFDELLIAELWGLPVLAFADVRLGALLLLCEAWAVVIPQIDTYADVVDQWTNHLQRPETGARSASH